MEHVYNWQDDSDNHLDVLDVPRDDLNYGRLEF